MSDRDRCDDRDYCCCKEEIADLLRDLSRGACSEVEVILTSGSDCCSIIGTICDVRRNDCVLVLCPTQQVGIRSQCGGPPPITRRGKCYVAVDKIAAVCEVCSGGFPPGHGGGHRRKEKDE